MQSAEDYLYKALVMDLLPIDAVIFLSALFIMWTKAFPGSILLSQAFSRIRQVLRAVEQDRIMI